MQTVAGAKSSAQSTHRADNTIAAARLAISWSGPSAQSEEAGKWTPSTQGASDDSMERVTRHDDVPPALSVEEREDEQVEEQSGS